MPGSTIASLRILLGLDAGTVHASATGVGNDLRGIQRTANQTNATLSQVGKGLQAGIGLGVGLGAFAIAAEGVRAFTGFIGESIKAAQDDEVATTRLTASLQANVVGWQAQAAAIEPAIKAGERLGFTDDMIRDSLARLVAATHDVNEAVRIQNVAMDLARFKGISLADATQALVTIEAGRFRGLAQLGIELKAGTTQVEALAAVEAVAAGQAEIFGKTSAGAAEEAGVAFHEAQESIGRGLLPAITELSHFARDVLAPALQLVGDNMGVILPVVEALALVLGGKLALGLARSTLEFGKSTAALIVHTFELGLNRLALIGAAEAEVGLGAAATAATPGVAGLGAAAATTDLALAPLVAIFGAAVIGGLALQKGMEAIASVTAPHFTAAVTDTAAKVQELTIKQAILQDQITKGNIPAGASVDSVTEAIGRLQIQIDQLTGADHTGKFNIALFTAKENADGLGKSLGADFPVAAATASHSVDSLTTNLQENTAALWDDFNALNGITGNALKAADALDTLSGAAARNVTAEFQHRMLGGDPNDTASNASLAEHNAKVIADRDAAAAAKMGAARVAEGNRGVADATKNAADIAAAYRDRLGGAFDAVKTAAHQFFDDLHRRNLDAIADAQRTADEQIDAQKRANNELVTDAERAFKAVQDQRQLASLQANLANVNADPEAGIAERIAAQQALNDFLTRQRIDAMRANADAANTQLDAQKAAVDEVAAVATKAENDRASAQTAAFDNDLAALQASLSKHPETWARTQQAILKLLMGYGVDYKKAGESLGEQFAAGLLASTRLAEDAAKALAAAVSGPLGVTPGTTPPAPGAPGTAPLGTLSPVTNQFDIHIYLDSEDITDRVDIRIGNKTAALTSGGIAG